MKYSKPIIALSAVLTAVCAFFSMNTAVFAGTFPIPKVDVYAKSILTKRVVESTTDDNGQFHIEVPEDAGDFNLFVLDGNMPPVKLTAKKGVVSGRVVVLTDNDLAGPQPVAATTVKKAPVAAAPTAPSKSINSVPKNTSVASTTPVKASATVPLLLRPVTASSTKGTIFENL